MQSGHPEFWVQVCHRLRHDYPDLYRDWFEALTASDIFAGQVVVEVSDPARLAYLVERCAASFSEAASVVSGHLVGVSFRSCSPSSGPRPVPSGAPRFLPLNPEYTFDEFVVGASTRLAHAASRAAAAGPGVTYNPLVVHGASGLGKSHLVQAVCWEIHRQQPQWNVCYVSCEAFVRGFIAAIESGRMQHFREAYRSTDVLAIDDVQFLADHESSQEEFFHTFNDLHQTQRQIILTADTPPREIPALQDRLISRLNWGLTAAIAAPDRETRRAILDRKARRRGYSVPDQILDLIAERVETNIRTLEGALHKAASFGKLTGEPITLDAARGILDELCGVRPRPVQIGDVLEAVSQYFGVRLAELVGKRRHRSIAYPRQIGMFLARKLTSLSLQEIGGHFGGRDHSTVLHAERSIESQRRNERDTAHAVSALMQRLSRA